MTKIVENPFKENISKTPEKKAKDKVKKYADGKIDIDGVELDLSRVDAPKPGETYYDGNPNNHRIEGLDHDKFQYRLVRFDGKRIKEMELRSFRVLNAITYGSDNYDSLKTRLKHHSGIIRAGDLILMFRPIAHQYAEQEVREEFSKEYNSAMSEAERYGVYDRSREE